MNYSRLLEATNSLSHLPEFVDACLQCWEKRVPFGIYNVTNTGSITTCGVCALMKQTIAKNKEFSFFEDETEFMHLAAKTPRSNCVLDNSKIRATGIRLQGVEDAVCQALSNWRPLS